MNGKKAESEVQGVQGSDKSCRDGLSLLSRLLRCLRSKYK